jgi:hypothetical protein
MLTLQERILLVKLCYKNDECLSAALRAYGTAKKIHDSGKLPQQQTLRALVTKFETTGTVENIHSGGRSSTSAEQKELIHAAISSAPSTSVRTLSRELEMSSTTVWRILHNEMRLHPYKIHIGQLLQPHHKEERFSFAQNFLHKNDEDPGFLPRVWWSDESNFPLCKVPNRQNIRHWTDNICDVPLFETPSHSPSLTVFIAFNARHCLPPFFFEESGKPVTVNGDRYRQMLSCHLIPELKKRHAFSQGILQQDGAPPHTAHETQQLLTKTFGPEKLIAKGFPMAWPPFSPDLSPCDYWLWDYLKERVYSNPQPETLFEIKQRICDICSDLSSEILTSVVQNILKRLSICEETHGEHLEYII